MVEEVTLDSSVLVSALVKGDPFRAAARLVMERIFSGRYHATTSAIVAVEVCGSISRRAGEDKALAARDQLSRWEALSLVTYNDLSGDRRDEAVALAVKLKLKGMDAIVVQVAEERGGVLISFDEEMAEKARAVVKVCTSKDFEAKPTV